MVKIQYNGKQATVTIPKAKVKALGWLERLEEGEDIEADVSTLPDRDGVSVREV